MMIADVHKTLSARVVIVGAIKEEHPDEVKTFAMRAAYLTEANLHGIMVTELADSKRKFTFYTD